MGVELGDRLRRQGPGSEVVERRAEQLHEVGAREVAEKTRHGEVTRRHEGFSRQRQGVGGRPRHAGLRKRVPRKVHVGQRALHHHHHVVRAAPAIDGIELGRARDHLEFGFAVARDEVRRIGVARHHQRRHGIDGVEPDLRHAGQPSVETLAPSRVEYRICGDHVDPRHAGHPGEQVEICGPETCGLCRLVRDGDDDVVPGRFVPAVRREQAHGVFVESTRVARESLELAERRREEAGLRQQACRTAVDVGFVFECTDQQAVEVVDRTHVPADGVVEVDHLGDDPGPHEERRRRLARVGVPHGEAHQRVARKRVEQHRVETERLGQPREEGIAREHGRRDEHRGAVGPGHT